MGYSQISFMKSAIIYLGCIAIILFLIALIISIVIACVNNIKTAKVEKRLRDEYYYAVHNKLDELLNELCADVFNKKDDK